VEFSIVLVHIILATHPVLTIVVHEFIELLL
jgi:hypothetical protein